MASFNLLLDSRLDKSDFFRNKHVVGSIQQFMNLFGEQPKVFLNCLMKLEKSLNPTSKQTSVIKVTLFDLMILAAS